MACRDAGHLPFWHCYLVATARPFFDPRSASWIFRRKNHRSPWTFADSMYGIGKCLIDRDGRVIGAHLPIGNGPLIAQAPAPCLRECDLFERATGSDDD
jgi:hypothetical protein